MRFSLIKKNVAEVVITSLLVVLMGSLVTGQEIVDVAGGAGEVPTLKLNYNGTQGTRDLILQDYSEKTGRTLLRDPNLPQANIILKSQTTLELDEYLEAIERALRMHGIQLIPVGEKFLKVVPVVGRPMQEGMVINETLDDEPLPETGKLVSQMVTLKHIDIPEAKKVILPFKHTYGFVLALERSNSILITDTAAVVNRMIQILKNIDQPIVAREQPTVVQIRFAKATTIKTKLEEIIRESQAEQKKKATVVAAPKKTGAPGIKKSVIPGVMRPTGPAPAPATVAAMALDMEQAERGVIRGKVQITADDRTNILIIITRPENMTFFNRIIEVLDVETAPDVIVRIFRLEFADSDNVATMLNNLIGMTKGKDDATAATAKKGDGKERASTLKEFASKKDGPLASAASKVGELSSQNIKILADKRTNALIVMASESDIQTLELIIDDMDMMLSQVLIEAVILDVGLDDVVQTGIDWVQRAMIAYDDRGKSGGKKSLFGFAGGGGGGTLAPLNTIALTSVSDLTTAMPTGHGLSYYFTHFGLNLDVILNMSANDTRTQIISSPVIVTHDNTEAMIKSSVERYFYKGKRWVSTGTSSGTYEDDVESREISLTLTVTPHINTNKLVVMDVVQQIQELGAAQLIGDTEWPTMNTREMKASISVADKETIVLGGLVKKGTTQINKGIPFLRKIPFIGALFRAKSDDTKRSEIVVFITPYVMNNQEEIRKETTRRKESLASAGKLWEKGWSDSKLAAPTHEQKKEEAKKKRQKKSEIREAELKALREREETRKIEEEEARQQAEEDARERAHQDRLKEIREEAEAKVKTEQDAKRNAREDARREREEKEAKVLAAKAAKGKAKAEEAIREKAEKAAKAKAKADTRAEKKVREKAEEEARVKAQAEEDAREKAEKEAKAKAKVEARAEEDAREQAEKEARAQAKADAKANVIATEQAKEAAEEEARRRAEEADPLYDLDPDLVDYIRKQEKRMQKKFKKVDKIVEEEMLD